MVVKSDERPHSRLYGEWRFEGVTHGKIQASTEQDDTLRFCIQYSFHYLVKFPDGFGRIAVVFLGIKPTSFSFWIFGSRSCRPSTPPSLETWVIGKMRVWVFFGEGLSPSLRTLVRGESENAVPALIPQTTGATSREIAPVTHDSVGSGPMGALSPSSDAIERCGGRHEEAISSGSAETHIGTGLRE